MYGVCMPATTDNPPLYSVHTKYWIIHNQNTEDRITSKNSTRIRMHRILQNHLVSHAQRQHQTSWIVNTPVSSWLHLAWFTDSDLSPGTKHRHPVFFFLPHNTSLLWLCTTLIKLLINLVLQSNPQRSLLWAHYCHFIITLYYPM